MTILDASSEGPDDHPPLARVERVVAPVREQVLAQLRQAIVQMRLKPAQRLVERELMEEIGVSRTTIREVLRQLTAEGLVKTIPNKGAIVAVPTRDEAAEIYEVRAELEGLAGRHFAEGATAEEVEALRTACERFAAVAMEGGDSADLLRAKARFYDIFFAGARNWTIASIIEGLQARVTVLRAASLSQPGRPAQTIDEVRAIVEAIERRDPNAAYEACTYHVRRAAQTILDALAAADAASSPEPG